MNNEVYLFAHRVRSKSTGFVFQGVLYMGTVSPIPGSVVDYGFLAKEIICVHNDPVKNLPLEECIRVVHTTDIWNQYHKIPLV